MLTLLKVLKNYNPGDQNVLYITWFSNDISWKLYYSFIISSLKLYVQGIKFATIYKLILKWSSAVTTYNIIFTSVELRILYINIIKNKHQNII